MMATRGRFETAIRALPTLASVPTSARRIFLSGLQKPISLTHLHAPTHQPFTFAHTSKNSHAIGRESFGVLHHDDRIGARGHRCSGHDLAALVLVTRGAGSSGLTGAGLADDAKFGGNCRQIFKPHGETIAYGFIESRRIGIGNDVLTKNPVHRLGQRNGLRRHSIRSSQMRCQIHHNRRRHVQLRSFSNNGPAVTTCWGQVELMNTQIDNQRIIDFHAERRAAFRDVDIARIHRDIRVFCLIRNGSPHLFRGFPFAGSKLYFLVHEILELKCLVVDGNKLCSDIDDGNSEDNEEQLSRFETKHRAGL